MREKGGKPKALAKFQFLLKETVEIMMARELYGWTERREGLDEDFPFDLAASGSPRDLSEELKGPLSRAKIRQMEAQIGIDDSDESHIRKMQAFGDHLCSDQDIDRAFLEGLKRLVIGVLAAHRISIHSCHPRIRKHALDGILHLLRPHAGVPNRWIFACGTRFGRALIISANVTCKLGGVTMVGERHTAIHASADVTTRLAEHCRGKASPVEEKDRLLAIGQALPDGVDQGRRANRVESGRAGGPAHIQHPDERHAATVDTLAELQESIFSGLHIAPTLHGGSRAAQHNGTPFPLGPQHSDIPGMITRRFLLLVRAFVLLIDDNNPQAVKRREDGAPRADNDARRTRMNLVPFVVTFARREMAVKHRNLLLKVGESCLKTFHRLRREGDLRHQDERGPAETERMLYGLQINFRLSAPGDAEEQQRPARILNRLIESFHSDVVVRRSA